MLASRLRVLKRAPARPITRLMAVPRATAPPYAAGAVITSDYLPWARVTASSFAAHNPGVRFVVLVADEPSPMQLRDHEPFELARLADVGLDGPEGDWMRLIYDGLELSCALKPWLLRLLLADAQAALYLDADLFVCGSLSEVAALARRESVVLSPHSLQPRTSPGLPDDDHLLRIGQFNGGFVAVGQGGREFVDWWASRLARGCTGWDAAAPLRFLDQRWLDLVVNYFPCAIDRDPGANVARWNLFQRRLELAGDSYTADGRPLRFVHFSGFDPGDPTTLSRLQRPHPSIDIERSPALARLVGDYVEQLLLAGWAPRGERAPAQAGGITLTAQVRAAIRAALVESERAGVAPDAGPSDPQVLHRWLTAPASPGGTSWYLLGLWASVPRLRGAFPRVPGADEPAYLTWSLNEGLAVGLVPPGLAGAARALRLDGAAPFVVLLEAAEIRERPAILAGLAESFRAGDGVSFLLAAPGAEPDALIAELGTVLAEHGLDDDDSPDVIAVLDAAAPAAIAPLADVVLTRRPATAFGPLPIAPDVAAVRTLRGTGPATPAAAAR